MANIVSLTFYQNTSLGALVISAESAVFIVTHGSSAYDDISKFNWPSTCKVANKAHPIWRTACLQRLLYVNDITWRDAAYLHAL